MYAGTTRTYRQLMQKQMGSYAEPEGAPAPVHRVGLSIAPVLVAEGVKVATGVIHTSAAGPNKDAAAQVLPLALSGNLAAVAAIENRAGIATVSSAQPWRDAFAQIPQAIKDAAHQAEAAGKIPAGDWWRLEPGQVYAAVQQYSVYYTPAAGDSGAVAPPPGMQRPAGTPPATAGFGGTMSLVLAAGLALAVLAGGARPRRRRRRSL